MAAHNLVATTKLKVLRERIAQARRQGIRIRSEWLSGETGGGCEIGGARWIFIDLSLPVDEQLAQLDDALATFAADAAADSSPVEPEVHEHQGGAR